MALTKTDYLRQLQALLPPGPAWSKDDSAIITRTFGALAAELARVDDRAWDMLDEADPRSTNELFTDWERVAGLPDACVVAIGGTQSLDQRRASLVGKLVTIGGQSIAYFVALALSLGYVITITEFHAHTVIDDVNHPFYDVPWNFAWQVNGITNTITYLSVIGPVSDPLAAWGNTLLQCVLQRLKPAHTTVLFVYT